MDTLSEPIFSQPESALRFAYGELRGDSTRPAAARMADKYHGRGSALGANRNGQAGMIKAKVERCLPPLFAAVVVAHYAPKSLPCSCGFPCCKGHAVNPEWMGAVRTIAELAASEALPGCVSYRSMREACIRRYFGDKVSMSEEAESVGIHINTASDHYSKIKLWLKGPRRVSGDQAPKKGIEQRALDLAHALMVTEKLSL